MTRSVDIVKSAALAPVPSSCGSGWCAKTPGSVRVFPEAVHVDVDESAELAGQVLDVHAGPAVNLRWVLAGEQRNSHGGTHYWPNLDTFERVRSGRFLTSP